MEFLMNTEHYILQNITVFNVQLEKWNIKMPYSCIYIYVFVQRHFRDPLSYNLGQQSQGEVVIERHWRELERTTAIAL